MVNPRNIQHTQIALVDWWLVIAQAANRRNIQHTQIALVDWWLVIAQAVNLRNIQYTQIALVDWWLVIAQVANLRDNTPPIFSVPSKCPIDTDCFRRCRRKQW